ncbi:ankyrin repeat domain-containing protein 26 isoform X7 [Marmota marmota marmota]|uniref:ankyrin repeat domain-containing protein 26 isoform X7 n=1 Tax=Marmota marmota marmota TaxID=9994 RepID=UPI0020936430|nr:ankyrin repeat domain-containing protein 26 isoform X7 [Marmota marmota marmota]
MKRIFGFGSKGRSPLGSSSNLRRNCVGFGLENASSLNSPRYHIRDKDTGKIHKAASMGNVAKVQHLLILGENGVNDKDKKNRTALHFACAYGHPEVVTLLVERKCNIDICDSDGSTALIKAVQCQEEECATILLEHGADPNVKDSSGNTALHYAVYIENTSIAVKLLLHNANTEAKNKDGHTPLLLALRENKQQMAEVLVNKKANIHAVDELERQVIFEYDEKRLKHSQINNSVLEIEPRASASCILVDESSEDESLTRLSNKPGPGDPWPTSDEEDSNFDTKNFPKVNLTELWTTTQQFKKNRAKYDILKPENRTLFDSSDSDSQNEDMDETLPKTSVKQSFSGPSILSSDPNEGATTPIIGKEENGTKSASQDQTNNGNLTYVDAGHKKSKSDLMSALGLGEEEEEESPWDSESISERLPQKGVSHLSGAVHERGNNINGQVEDMIYIPSCMSGSRNFKMAKLEKTRNVGIPVANMESPEKYPQLKTTSEMKDSLLSKAIGMKDVQTFKSEPNLEVTSEEEQKRLDGSENNQSQVEEKRKEHKGNEMEVSETLSDGFAATDNDDGLIQQRKNEKTDNQKFPIEENKKHEGDPALHTKEVKKNENEKYTSKESVTTPAFEMADSLTGGLIQVKDGCHLSEIDQDEERPIKKASIEKEKAPQKINAMDDLDDLTQSSETASEDYELLYPSYENMLLLIEQLRMEYKDSVSLLKLWDAVHSYKRLIELKKSHCELLIGKIKKMENKVCELQKELSSTKEVKSQLEHEKVEWEGEIHNLRFALKEEKEKRRNADNAYEKIKQHLRKKEEQYNKEVEVKQQLEISLRTLEVELKTVKINLNQVLEDRNDLQRQLTQEQNARILQDGILANHLCKQKEIEMAQTKMSSEVSISHEKEKNLLHKSHSLQKEISMIRLEIDTIKNQNQEKEKKYLEDVEIANEKNDNLQKTIKLNEETFTTTVLQYNGHLSILTAQNTMLNSKLENEKQNKERLEIEVESYRSRLAAAIHDYDESQASKRDIELAFQRSRDECFRLQDKMNFSISNLKDNNEILSQQLSKAERKFNSLEIELHHTKDALREKTLVLEQVQRDLNQTQGQMKEIECMYQNEQCKVNKYVGKQESLEERLSQLQSENTLLRQQLDDAQNKADNKEKTVINIQDQFHDIVKKLQAESKKQNLMLEDRNKELINECNHLKERLYQYENEKAERESEDDKEQLKKLTELKQSLEYTLDQEKKKNGKLEKELTGFKKLLKMTKTKLNKYENGEFSFHEDLKNSSFEMDIPINMLIYKIDDLAAKLETASSKCLHLDKKNQFLHQELLSMKTMQKKCEKLEKNKKKLEQEVVNLKSHIEKKNMEEHGQLEQYKQEIEDRARQDLVEKLKQVNLFLKTQAASQENLEQLRESNNASIRSQMELRIKDLEYELSKIKTQEDSNKIELEKYKQLYVEEFKIRKSLLNKLNKANERLEDVNTQLLVEKQNRSLLSTVSPRPVVECSCVGSLNNSLVLNRSYFPRENLVVPTSNPKPSNKSMENYLAEMQQKLEKSITRELKEVADELESGSLRASPLGSTHKSSQDLLSEASQEYVEILKKKYMI